MSLLNKTLVICLLLGFCYAKKLPDFIKRCKYTTDGAELGKCVKEVFEANKEKFIAGVPEMHIPSMDPFSIPRIDFGTANGSIVGINAVFTNVKVQGAGGGKIERAVADIPNGKVLIEVSIPELSIVGDYQLDGRILVLQINGSGKGEGNFTGLRGTNTYDGKFVTRNNKEYVEWSNPQLDLSVEGMSINFDNLFNGNEELTKSTNLAINDNAKEILKEMKPLVEETISSILFSLVEQVFHTYSVDELFEK